MRTRALQFLARREYSRVELYNRLLPHAIKAAQQDGDIALMEDSAPEFALEKGQARELDALLDDLVARGWLSDQRTASQYIDARRGRFGTQRLVYELRQKGISEDLIDARIPELKATELEAALLVWQRRFGALPADDKEKARQVRFLQSRGFPLEAIFRVLRLADRGE